MLENVMEELTDLQLDIGDSCDSLAILADDVVTISEDLKKDIAALQRQLDTCKTFLIHCQSQHMHRNDQRFVSIPPETQLTERF